MRISKSNGTIFSFVLIIIISVGIVNFYVRKVSAKIENVWIEHDVYQDDQQGMKIHIDFSVSNMLNKTGECIVYFYSKNRDVLLDNNQKYQVSSVYTFTPDCKKLVYNDLVIFIPYKEFNLPYEEQLRLEVCFDFKFQVEVVDDNLKSIAQSNYYHFSIKIEPSEYVSLNKDYNWYIPQRNTGYASNNNCAPACAVMAAKWADQSFKKSVEDARNTYPHDGKGWTMRIVYDFLNENKISCTRFQDKISEASIKKHLNNGNIIIVSINNKDITYNKNAKQRTGKYHNGEGRHAIIIKGYSVIYNKTFLEIYDPAGSDQYYSDGTPKGIDRYYLSDEVVYSVSTLHYVVIYPKKSDEK